MPTVIPLPAVAAPQSQPPQRAAAAPTDRPSPVVTSATTTVPTTAPTMAPTATRPPAAPTATATPAPTATPVVTLRRLTDGGCCVSPVWLPDSRRVVFIDRPPNGPVGLYAVDVDKPGAPTLFSARLGYYAAGYTLLWQPVGETVQIERLSDGQRFTLNNGGRTITVSPDGRLVSWQVTPTQTDIPLERRTSQVWVANIDGSGARAVASLLRGGVSGWFPDGQRMLVTSRPDPRSQAIAVSVLSLADGSLTEVARAERLRSAAVSPDGEWVFYSIAFNPDLSQNGLWLARAQGGGEPRKLDFYGATAWRGANKLVYIPLDLDAEWHEVWEYDPAADKTRPLTDPAVTPFKVTNGDWTLSPDGRNIVFVAAQDRNLWRLEIGD